MTALAAATQKFFDDRGDFLRGRVRNVGAASAARASLGKAMALEYGAHGTAKVSASERTLSHFWGRQVEPQQVFVEAYSRHLNIAASRFLRNAADSVREAARAAVEEAIAESEK